MRSYSMNIEKKNLKVAARRGKIRLRRERKKNDVEKRDIVEHKNEVEKNDVEKRERKKLWELKHVKHFPSHFSKVE